MTPGNPRQNRFDCRTSMNPSPGVPRCASDAVKVRDQRAHFAPVFGIGRAKEVNEHVFFNLMR